MTVVEDYWGGVVQRLQAEVDVFSRLVGHKGEQGRENELALARVLEGLIPQRLGVGTGVLIDADGRRSQQTDVVVFDAAGEPALMAQTTQLIFPVESVLATIEVKTSLQARDIDDFAEKSASLQSLAPRRTYRGGGEGTHPIQCLVAYSLRDTPANIHTRLRAVDRSLRPDVLCVIKHGLVAGRSTVVGSSDGSEQVPYHFGVAAVRQPDGALARPLDSEATEEARDGRMHSLVETVGGTVLADSGRALLLLCQSLLRGVSRLEGRPESVLSLYLSADAYTLELVSDDEWD